MKIQMANPEHEVAYQDLVALVNRHADKMTPIELLAIAANMVGKLIALQDQRRTSPALAMKTVSQNIQFGNQSAIDSIMKSQGSA